jgi:hypothetical protein
MWLSGHDHGLQIINEPGSNVYYVVSGAGSNTNRGRFKGLHQNDTLFLTDQPGFAAVSIKGGTLRIDTFSIHSPIHTFTTTINK